MKVFRLRTRPPSLTRRQTLESAIVRNPQVNERIMDAGHLELTVRLKPRRWMRWLGQPADAPVVRRHELDELGAYVWKQCDSSQTVEQMIRQFADEHQLNLRESEMSIMAFISMLMKRGLIGVAPPTTGDPESDP